MTTEIEKLEELKDDTERNIEWEKKHLKEMITRFILGVNRIDTENVYQGAYEIIGLHSEIRQIEEKYNSLREEWAILKRVNWILEDREGE